MNRSELRVVELTETQLTDWGERIGAAVTTPAFFALRGDLGAGKSVLARAIARGAGVTAAMPSPTFNLVFRYSARDGIDVVHMDLYRLERPDEVWPLGWSDIGRDSEIVLVEWPERAGALLPPDRWDVTLEYASADTRAVTVTAVGSVPPVPEPAG